MRKALLLLFFAGLFQSGFSQSFTFSCTRDTAIPCSQTCFTLYAKIPDLHGLSNTYSVNPLSATNGCYNPYVPPGIPGVPTSLNVDDVYSGVIDIGFPFIFFGQTYTQLVASANGYLSFDISKAGLFSHYQIFRSGGVLSTSGTPLDLPSTLYDKGLIMGPYHDLDPAYTTSPTHQIKYDTLGVAPNRKWVLSFYKIPLYNCQDSIKNSSQIVLYEGTGMVEIFISEQQICGWQVGKAMVGMQDFARTNFVMAPGRKASDPAWGIAPMNESWRFVPSGGPSLFKRVELYSLNGTLLSVGDTVGIGNGVLNCTFLNVCPTISNTKVIVKSFYQKIDDPGEEIVGTDTINTIRNAGPINANATPASCVTNLGTITVTNPVTVPLGPTYEYSLDAGPWQLSNIFNNVPIGAHVVSARIVLSTCSSSTNVTISSVNTLTATAGTIDAACTGSATGSIIINASLGTPPYTYSLDGGPYQVSDTFHNVAPGNHIVIVKDAGGCTFTINNIFVSSGSGIIASATTTNASCPGAANGSITVNPQNGQAPFTYSLNGAPFQSSNVFTGLAPGNYTIIVKDNTGCTATLVKTVGADAGFTATAVTTNSGCTPSGTITVTPTPPATGPFTYSLDGGAAQVSNVFTNVSGGSHTVLVTQASICTYTITQIMVGTNSGITATADSTNTECSGAFTGTINVIASNGVAPYTYKIDGGAFQASALFTGLAAGNHTITVLDNSGCSFSFIKGVGAGVGISATSTSTNTACGTASTGTITVTPTTGISPFLYKIDAGIYQGSNFFSGLSAGIHNITVKDSAGCTYSFTQTVIANAGVNATATTTNTACNGVSTGSITVNTTMGSAPFTYSVDGGALVPTNVFNNLGAGNHPILVMDAAGCTFTFVQSISANPGVTAIADSTNTACGTATTGSITVTASAGILPYTYSINGGAFQVSNQFNGLGANTYTIKVKDAAGCTYTLTKTVSANAGVTFNYIVQPAGCPGSNTGVITVNPSNGISPYLYSLNGGAFQVSNTFSNLASGSYNVKVKDAAGCTFTQPVPVGTNPLVTASLIVVQPGCFGTATGSITINPSLGTSPYLFALNGSAFQANNLFSNLVSGNYTVHVKDATNCTFDTALTLIQPALFKVSASTLPATCNGNDGVINIFPTGGTAPFLYSENGGITYGSSGSIIDSLGSYNIRIKDANGCTADTLAVVIALNDTMRLSLSPDTTVCVGSTVAFTPSTNSQTNVFIWTPAGGTLNPATGAYSINPGDTTTYFLTAKWGVCQRSASGTVDVLHKPDANAGADTIICDKTFAFLRGMATNLSGPVNYLWSPATNIIQPDSSFTTVFPKTNGTNVYTLEVDDNYGCNFKVFDKVLVTMNYPVAAFAGRDTIAAMDLPHQLFGSGGISYLWSPPFVLDNPSKKNPIATLHNDTRFVLTVTDNGGCIGTDTVFVKVYKGPAYYLPNAFTPNGDGKNDIFKAIPPGISSTEYFRIFNRWGQMIFETHDYLKGWDGTYIGKPQPAGAYVWIIKGVDKFGKPVEIRGTVMLIR